MLFALMVVVVICDLVTALGCCWTIVLISSAWFVCAVCYTCLWVCWFALRLFCGCGVAMMLCFLVWFEFVGFCVVVVSFILYFAGLLFD